MTQQKDVFLHSEGDAWYQRNRMDEKKFQAKLDSDPVLSLLKDLNLAPKSVLEIGCSDGWRLAGLRKLWPKTSFKGIDPAATAAAHSYDRAIEIEQGTADDLPYRDKQFDLVIFGFCLYLCDRQDLFRIAMEADRVLMEGGHIVIYDFHTEKPYRNTYVHHEGVYSYKMDYSRLFSWSPAYKMVKCSIGTHPGSDSSNPDNDVGVFVLKKSLLAGWPDRV